jgi:hypothetical protein
MNITGKTWLLDGMNKRGKAEGRRDDTKIELRGKEANFFTKSLSAAER